MGFYFLSLESPIPTIDTNKHSLISAEKKARTLGVFDRAPPEFTPKISVSACYTSYANKYVLLQRKIDKMWGVPGGKIEKDESPLYAILRECLEETGIYLKRESIRFIKTVYISDPDKDFIFHIYAYVFDEKPNIMLHETEHQDYTWKTLEECMEMPLIWGEKEVLEKYIKN